MSFDAKTFYLKALAKITMILMHKEILTEVFRRYEECRNNKPNLLADRYCNELDPRTRANYCFNAVFTKVDIFLTNELCFETADPTIPIPV